MDKMQEEAMRRVNQMQSGSQVNRQQGVNRSGSEPKKTAEPYGEKNEINTGQDKEPNNSQDPLSGLFKDKEKLLILLLIMLLSQESENTELVLALLYVII